MMTTPEPPLKTHRNETLLHIVLPVAGGGLLILIAVVIALVLQRRVQVQILADVLSIIFLLCPMLVCMFPIYLLLVVLAAGMGRIHDGTVPYLERVQNFTRAIAEQAHTLMSAITKRVISLSTKIEPFLDKLSIFDKDNPQGK
jgi:E3 ubiquitin-protein ligase DOA10